MAVRTHRNQILHGIDGVLLVHVSQRYVVMNVDVPLRQRAVLLAEVEPAHGTVRPVMLNTSISGLSAALVGVHQNHPTTALDERLPGVEFLG